MRISLNQTVLGIERAIERALEEKDSWERSRNREDITRFFEAISKCAELVKDSFGNPELKVEVKEEKPIKRRKKGDG